MQYVIVKKNKSYGKQTPPQKGQASSSKKEHEKKRVSKKRGAGQQKNHHGFQETLPGILSIFMKKQKSLLRPLYPIWRSVLFLKDILELTSSLEIDRVDYYV